MEEIERWAEIPGFNDYRASSLGRVASKEKILKLYGDGRGYLQVSLRAMSRQRVTKVHRCVLLAFVGPRPEKYHAAHLNGIKTDNRLSNLRWVTQQENEAHKKIHGTTARGETHGAFKLTDNQVLEIRRDYRRGTGNKSNSKELSDRFGVCKSTISKIGLGYRRAADAAEDKL